MADRLNCCVPFCRRTTRNDNGYTAWICGKHWTTVPRSIRAPHLKAQREYRRQFGRNAYWEYPPGSEKRIACVLADHECNRAWTAVVDYAIESAAGIL